jgi:hypothetical protein
VIDLLVASFYGFRRVAVPARTIRQKLGNARHRHSCGLLSEQFLFNFHIGGH